MNKEILDDTVEIFNRICDSVDAKFYINTIVGVSSDKYKEFMIAKSNLVEALIATYNMLDEGKEENKYE